MAFAFTDDDFAAGLIERAHDGLQVSGVFEKSQVESNIGREFDTMRAVGLDLLLDSKPRKMEHKVIHSTKF